MHLALPAFGGACLSAPLKWAYYFGIGGGLTSLTYGLASAATVLQPDQFIQVVIITGQGAYVTIQAVRNNAVPRAAGPQGALPLAFLAVACFATRKPFYMGYGVLVLFHLVCVLQIVSFLSKKTRDLLVAEESATTANARLEELATTDPLTGATNRRGFDAAMSKAIAHAQRHDESLSLLILDIDHFKALNDAFGHQSGDECLRTVGACLQKAVRPSDLVSRHGGEEFAILLPATDGRGAAVLAERVRAAIEALGLVHPTSASGVTTVSVGHATIERAETDAASLGKHADSALYAAKNAGRNRISGNRTDDERSEPHVAALTYDLIAI